MIYKLSKSGILTEFIIDVEKIQKHINSVRNSLGEKYEKLESECIKNTVNDIVYRTYFVRNTIDIPIEKILEQKIVGEIADYEYYEDIYFDEKYQIYYYLKARIDSNWEYRYIIPSFIERINSIIINKLNQLIS